MSKNNETLEAQKAMMGLPNTLTTPSIDDELKQLQLQKLKADLAKELEEQNKKEETKEQLKRRREMIKAQVDASEKERIRTQEACNHLKPSGKKATAGIHDQNRNLIVICQNCQKVWNDNSIPGHLIPDAVNVGGPAY